MKPSKPIKTDANGRAAYRLREASELTGIPASTFRTKIRRGELNPITGFGVWLIAADDLQELLNKRLRNRRGIPSAPDVHDDAGSSGSIENSAIHNTKKHDTSTTTKKH